MIRSDIVRGSASVTVRGVVDAFGAHERTLASEAVSTIPQVLDQIRPHLIQAGWACSNGRRATDGVVVGRTSRQVIRAEGLHPEGVAFWIELGRSWTNFGFLQHLVEASLTPGIDDAVIALRDIWDGRVTYDKCRDFLLDVEESSVDLPVRSVTLIGF